MSNEDDQIIVVGSRLAVQKSDCFNDWWMSYSPRNDNANAEGTWQEWVTLAQMILAEHSKRVAKTLEGER